VSGSRPPFIKIYERGTGDRSPQPLALYNRVKDLFSGTSV
jgi:hypothetical protein